MVDFLIIGTYNAVAYSNIFPDIRKETIMIGYNRVGEFSDGEKFGNSIWFTSLSVDDRPPLDLVEYREGDYGRYDHFDAVNVDKVVDIPDYEGVMGVPITFLEKWCRRQFVILDARDYRTDDRFKDMEVQMLSGSGGETAAVGGKKRFGRILIMRRNFRGGDRSRSDRSDRSRRKNVE